MRLYLLAALLLVTGCASSGGLERADRAPRPSAYPNHSAAQVLSAMQTLQIGRVSGRGDIVLRSPKQNGSFGVRVLTERGGSTLASVRAFGFEGARVLVRPDSFFAVNKLEKSVQLGSLQEAAGALPFPIGPDGAFEALTGLITLDPAVAWQISPTSDAQYLLRSPDGKRAFTVDPARWRVTRFVGYDASGALAAEQVFERFVDVDGYALPSRITLRQPSSDTEARFVYSDLTLNPDEALPSRLDLGGLRVVR